MKTRGKIGKDYLFVIIIRFKSLSVIYKDDTDFI